MELLRRRRAPARLGHSDRKRGNRALGCSYLRGSGGEEGEEEGETLGARLGLKRRGRRRHDLGVREAHSASALSLEQRRRRNRAGGREQSWARWAVLELLLGLVGLRVREKVRVAALGGLSLFFLIM